MIKSLIVLITLIVPSIANNFIDKNASTITKDDMHLMQEFDTLVYSISDEDLKPLDINSIYAFIKKNKAYITDYDLLKINLKASTGTDDYDYVNETQRDKDYKKASIELVYPIYDTKSRKDIKNKKLEYNFKILDEIKKYSNLRDKKLGLQRELKFDRLMQIREKLQVKKGVKYLDDKLKTIEKILKLQNDILEVNTDLVISQKNLLNYVKKNARDRLKEMLNEI